MRAARARKNLNSRLIEWLKIRTKFSSKNYLSREWARVISGRMWRRRFYVKMFTLASKRWRKNWRHKRFNGDRNDVKISRRRRYGFYSFYSRQPRVADMDVQRDEMNKREIINNNAYAGIYIIGWIWKNKMLIRMIGVRHAAVTFLLTNLISF